MNRLFGATGRNTRRAQRACSPPVAARGKVRWKRNGRHGVLPTRSESQLPKHVSPPRRRHPAGRQTPTSRRRPRNRGQEPAVSVMPCNPRNVSASAAWACSRLACCLSTDRRARARTRSPRAAIVSAVRCTASLSSAPTAFFGARAGLVRANHRGAAERLNGGQLADDRFSSRETRDADGEHDGHRSGQTLGNRPDCERHRGHEHLDPFFAARDAKCKGRRRQSQNDPEDELAELRDLLCQRRGQLHRASDELSDAPRLRLVADGAHDTFGLAPGDEHRVMSVPA